MSGRDSFQPHPETGFASTDVQGGVSTLPMPRQNRLLAALPTADYERLLPDLEPVPLPLGWIVHGAGDRERHLYFVTAGMVSRLYVLKNGASAEYAVTGREGAIGVASFLGGQSTPSQAVVLDAGYAYRLSTKVLQTEFARCGPLLHVLLRYTLALITQTAQTAVCNRHHSVEQQLCRWLLLSLDRMPGSELSMTQELIASMLGVRREGVTEAAQRLQQAGLIHYSRGHIAVIDRAGLQARVCECYAVVEHEYDRLLGPEHICRSAGVRAVHVARSISGNQSALAPVTSAARVPANTGPSTRATRRRTAGGDAQAPVEPALA